MYPAPLTSAIARLVRPEVAALPAYDPGADPVNVLRECGLRRVIKLSNNENPCGISPHAAQAMSDWLRQAAGLYPDPVSNALRDVLAKHHDLGRERIIIGNGSENILELLCLAFLEKGDRVVTQTPCFGLHEIFPLMMGARVDKVSLTHEFGFNERAWKQALTEPAKLILVSNPSNPAGTIFTEKDLTAIAEAAPTSCLLVLDEAYFEYAINDPTFPDAFEMLRKTARPWIVLRTFSKAYGLAGLRVGYGMASHTEVIDALNRVRTPYNVNQLAQVAAIAALADTNHLHGSVSLVARERKRLTEYLTRIGLTVAPSLANFLFIDTGSNGSEVVRRLLQEGIIVKAWHEAGFEQFIRVSIGQPEDNDQFLDALSRVIATT